VLASVRHGARSRSSPRGFDVERARRVQELAEGRLTVVQVLSWEIDGGPEQEEHLRRNLARAAAEPAIDRLLVDSKVGKERGGTGVSFDWERAHALLAELAGGAEGMPLGKPLLIAGGLRPETVAGAVLTLHPWGVDVSSGVESRPGKKDSDKIKEFLSSARSARLASA
jgi:phosphoribosylanthranilate isomerase